MERSVDVETCEEGLRDVGVEGGIGRLRTWIGHAGARAFAGGEEAKEETKRLGKVHGIVGGDETRLLRVVLNL